MTRDRWRRERTARNRQLSKDSTLAEKNLWNVLRNRRFQDLKFRRQHGVGPYVADFCCLEHRLIIEVDGGVHDSVDQAKKDRCRTENLEAEGWVVIRFGNEEVLGDVGGCLERLAALLGSPHPPPPLSRRRERGARSRSRKGR